MFRFTPTVAFEGSIFLTGASQRHATPSDSLLFLPLTFLHRLYSEEELPPEFKLFIPTAPATRGLTSETAGGDKTSLRGKKAVLEARTPPNQSAIDKLSDIDESEIVEESYAGFCDGSVPEVSEPSSGLDEIDQRNDLNGDGLIEKEFVESRQQGIALSS